MRPRPDHSIPATSAAVVAPSCNASAGSCSARRTSLVHHVEARRFIVTGKSKTIEATPLRPIQLHGLTKSSQRFPESDPL